ncbi:MAG: nuclear transport factor 2 family protein [Actinomycetota bacterium]|nr:nuclear transport factor 2 family protein [Actinomycetota bacterium]
MTHPYRRLWETRDIGALRDALTEDVVLRSPLIVAPFEGRAAAIELFEVLVGALEEFEIAAELRGDEGDVFWWRAAAGGREIEGVDLIRMEGGKIAEIRVLVRPLIGLGTLAAVIGPPLAARRGRLRGLVARPMVASLRMMLAFADVVSTRLVRSRRAT